MPTYRGGGGGGRSRGRGSYQNQRGQHQNQQRSNVLGHTLVKLCREFASSGSCSRGNNCAWQHVIHNVSSIQNSNPQRNNSSKFQPTSDIALWMEKPDSPLKLFTSSYDGCWRLYNTANGFQKEVEHNMNGKVFTVMVKHNFLFCGFEAPSVKIPNQMVGMIFAWNLNNPGDVPMELHMGRSDLMPYAHAKGVGALLIHEDVCFSGGLDAMIRIWKFDNSLNNGKGGFKFLSLCAGHVGEVTGLLFLNGLLWSSSTDGTIRLWDSNDKWECKHLITSAAAAVPGSALSPVHQNGTAAHEQQQQKGPGHTDAVTSLIHFQNEQAGSYVISSSLDGNVKVWNSTNGECVSTTPNGEGILSMALTTDLKGHPILICGSIQGKIIFRSVLETAKTKPMCLTTLLDSSYSGCGHNGPVKRIVAGPPGTNYSSTFYTAGEDGKFLIWQITGDLGLP